MGKNTDRHYTETERDLRTQHKVGSLNQIPPFRAHELGGDIFYKNQRGWSTQENKAL